MSLKSSQPLVVVFDHDEDIDKEKKRGRQQAELEAAVDVESNFQSQPTLIPNIVFQATGCSSSTSSNFLCYSP